jgi:hypothetical protein
LNGYTLNRSVLLSGLEGEDCSTSMTANSIHLPEPIKERLILSRESQQETATTTYAIAS